MLIRRLLVVPVLFILAACSAAASATPSATPTAAASSAAASASASASSSEASGGVAEIDAEDSSLGTILVDDQGNTIYFFDDDQVGVSNCTGDCIANWPPVSVSATPEAGSGVNATLGTLDHPGGTPQLTVNGHPAYYYAGDQAAGDTNGQGVFNKWWVFGADGDPIKTQ